MRNAATLSPQQILNRQLLAAKHLVQRHPRDDAGTCASCGVVDCDAGVVAQAFLDRFAEAPEPILRSTK